MKRRFASVLACLALASIGVPSVALASDNGWSVSSSTDQVKAAFLSTSVSDARLSLENNVTFRVFGLQHVAEILDALGFGGGYGQEASWTAATGPQVSCPEVLVNLPLSCRSDGKGGGTVLIPDGLRAELAVVAPSSSGATPLVVQPDLISLGYDGTVAAIGMALEVLSPGPIGGNASQITAIALQLLPEASSYAAAMQRGDSTEAFNELVSLTKRALAIIRDHATDWAIGTMIDVIPGALEIKIGLACAKAVVALANLDQHLLSGDAGATVTVTFGGSGGSGSVSPASSGGTTAGFRSGTFTAIGSMSTDRNYQTATLLQDGRVLIAGGMYGGDTPVSSAELYDPKTGTFGATGSMTFRRAFHTATLLEDGTVLIVGGSGAPVGTIGSYAPLDSAELYDPSSGTFRSAGSMTTPRAFHTATLLQDGTVLVAGGAVSDSNIIASAELYDPSTGTFRPTGSMTPDRRNHSATLLPNGQVLVAGGLGLTAGGSLGPALATAELYDPRAGTFRPTGSMGTARDSHTATLLQNGRVLVAGGFTATAELYDPGTGSFSATGSLATILTGHTATLLPGGRVLIAGGTDGNADKDVATAALYDPKTGTFSPTGSMSTPRADHTATLLLNGLVLVAGGRADQIVVPSAELYGDGEAQRPPSPTPPQVAGSITFSPSTISCSDPVDWTEVIRLPASVKVGDTLTEWLDGQKLGTVLADPTRTPSLTLQPDGTWQGNGTWSAPSMLSACNQRSSGVSLTAQGTHTMQYRDARGQIVAQGSYTVQ